MSDQYRVYPSSVAYVENDQVMTTRSNACLRLKWFKHHGVKTKDISPVYQLAGAFWEGWVADQIVSENWKQIITGQVEYQREKTYRMEMAGAFISCRADFVLGSTVTECKALTTSNLRLKHIRKGVPASNHVIQNVLTCLAAERPLGEVRYGYVCHPNDFDEDTVEKGDQVFAVTEERRYQISYDNSGAIFVDGEPHGDLTIPAILDYTTKEVAEVPSDSIPDRPYVNEADPWTSPCTRCVFAGVCDSTDAEEISTGIHWPKEKLLKEAQISADNEKPYEAKLFNPKRKIKEL